MKQLRTQLSGYISVVLLLVIGSIGLLSNFFVNREFTRYISGEERKRSETIVDDLSRQYNSFLRTWNVDYVNLIGLYSLYDGYILKVYDLDGNTVWDAENHDTSLYGEVMKEIEVRMKERGEEGGFHTSTFSIEQNGYKVGKATIAYYGPYFLSESDFSFIRTLNAVLLTIGALALLLAIFVGYFIARRIAKPVTNTALITSQIAEGNYSIRCEDVTKTRELHILVESINNLAETLSRQENLQKRLTTNVAHELRTPLTAVGSYLEAMILGLWEATPERLQSCYDEVKRLGALTEDLGQLTKIENEKLVLKKKRVDLRELAETVSLNLHVETERKKLNLTVVGESVFVEADRDRIKQVFTNLLSNAIKYTPDKGRIVIEMEETQSKVVVRVCDSGIGISADELPLIFERFYRTDQSRNRKTGGAGIGLTIVKTIVEAHGGYIRAESTMGKGSCFTIMLPKA